MRCSTIHLMCVFETCDLRSPVMGVCGCLCFICACTHPSLLPASACCAVCLHSSIPVACIRVLRCVPALTHPCCLLLRVELCACSHPSLLPASACRAVCLHSSSLLPAPACYAVCLLSSITFACVFVRTHPSLLPTSAYWAVCLHSSIPISCARVLRCVPALIHPC